ncbi:protein transport protein bos1 [Tulasnella sp. 330]|nr:protein transport protein bos1 [Tulasnella sp. 330]KAG8886073.1 protein transport protein bos1 [Tulasnella sp. 331]KAG8890248.1 protein transport protein bos1 [Tulasnella sp. 332]
MNSLYTLGVRQTSSIQADLDKLKAGDFSTALQGQISASLAALNRTVDDYDSMAKREMIKAKQEKAHSRVQKFRADYTELRSQFEGAKLTANNARASAQRNDLLGDPSSPSSAPRQRFSQTPATQIAESPFSQPPSSTYGPSSQLRSNYALDEHSFIQNTETQLDGFIAQGREVLDNLVDQRNILKGTQKRLLDAANTIGLSRNVIGWIEKRRHTSFYFVRDQPIAHIVGSPFYFNSSAGASTLFTNSTVNHDQTTVTADRPKKQRLARNHPYDQGGRVSQLRMKKTEATNLDEVVTPGLTVLGGGDTTSVVKFAWSLAADVLGTLRRETAAEDEAARLDDEEARRCACVVPGAYPAHYRRFAHGVV